MWVRKHSQRCRGSSCLDTSYGSEHSMGARSSDSNGLMPSGHRSCDNRQRMGVAACHPTPLEDVESHPSPPCAHLLLNFMDPTLSFF